MTQSFRVESRWGNLLLAAFWFGLSGSFDLVGWFAEHRVLALVVGIGLALAALASLAGAIYWLCTDSEAEDDGPWVLLGIGVLGSMLLSLAAAGAL